MSCNATVTGVLGKDPKVFETGNGKVTTFSLASNRVSKNEKITDWFNVVAFGNSAETIAKYVSKGDQLICHGFMIQEKYTDSEGVNKTSYKLELSRFDFGRKKGGDYVPGSDEDDGDDIPF